MSATPATLPTAVTYTIDPAHSSAQFKVRHMMIASVRGEFGKVAGTIVYNTQNPAASEVTAEIDVESISTHEPQRDAHLKSPDFFDILNHPKIKFHSKKIVATEPGSFKLAGDLTIHGVTREEVLEVENLTEEQKDPWGNLRRGVEARAKISRKDYGLVYNQALETGGVLVGDAVEITLDVQLVRQA
jgi:polyisoprenoid-binding protein YceI